MRYELCIATILNSYKLYHLMNQNKLLIAQRSIKKVVQQQISDEDYLSELSKELGSNSILFKVRKYILQHYKYEQVIDKIWFSELENVNEDNVNKKIFIKALTSFEDSYIKSNYKPILEHAFEAQGFSFELVKFIAS
ncbi:hypothetical protein OTT_0956 [Orientia tsutsugamushi str. Ikeda]|uniref:DnaA N-terminal domain-containing protein n=3 Tax=Orientia tsutsugamushi TaxID=784 RepID=B3CSR7_ORITI|nr:hypothetical protein [Orientia tsutsugamushi]BAG40414.1 hypothetical protein OTT_0956 [Orientia tsutsugamushi str. Ikeda]